MDNRLSSDFSSLPNKFSIQSEERRDYNIGNMQNLSEYKNNDVSFIIDEFFPFSDDLKFDKDLDENTGDEWQPEHCKPN